MGYQFSDKNPSTRDVLLFKLDAKGEMTWIHTYDARKNLDDIGEMIEINPQGGYIVGGWTWAENQKRSSWIFGIDENGKKTWHAIFDRMLLRCFKVVDKNHLLLAATIDSTNGTLLGTKLIFINLNARVVWDKYLDRIEIKSISSSPFGFTFSGSIVNDNDGRDAIVLGFDRDGKLIWKNIYGDKNDDHANGIISLPDTSYIVVGSTQLEIDEIHRISRGFPPISYGWVLKLNKLGNLFK